MSTRGVSGPGVENCGAGIVRSFSSVNRSDAIIVNNQISGTGTLPMTGVPGSTLPVGIAGLGLLLAGGLALVVAYRRRPGQH